MKFLDLTIVRLVSISMHGDSNLCKDFIITQQRADTAFFRDNMISTNHTFGINLALNS